MLRGDDPRYAALPAREATEDVRAPEEAVENLRLEHPDLRGQEREGAGVGLEAHPEALDGHPGLPETRSQGQVIAYGEHQRVELPAVEGTREVQEHVLRAAYAQVVDHVEDSDHGHRPSREGGRVLVEQYQRAWGRSTRGMQEWRRIGNNQSVGRWTERGRSRCGGCG